MKFLYTVLIPSMMLGHAIWCFIWSYDEHKKGKTFEKFYFLVCGIISLVSYQNVLVHFFFPR